MAGVVRRGVLPGEEIVITPVSWSFSQPATAAVSPELQPTYFYRSDTNRRWERFGYSTDDARSLIEYLNSRT